MKNGIIISMLALVFMSFFTACSSIPDGATAVKPFELKKYLGKWYEIARMDFKYERDMNNVTATYTMNDDGSVKVDNQGYNYVDKEWKQAIGKAKFRGEPDEAKLKVSFFGPFYSGYNVIALDPEYKYALVAGNDLDLMWILARTTTIPDDIKQKYLAIAKSIGYDTSALIWVEHNMKK